MLYQDLKPWNPLTDFRLVQDTVEDCEITLNLVLVPLRVSKILLRILKPNPTHRSRANLTISGPSA